MGAVVTVFIQYYRLVTFGGGLSLSLFDIIAYGGVEESLSLFDLISFEGWGGG